MKIAIVRGDFLSSWEIPNFAYLIEKHDVTFFLGRKPVFQVDIPKKAKVVQLFSPVDLNFGKVSRWRMAILNRLFTDAHVLFRLEEKLKGFDVAYIAETFYKFCLQAVQAKEKGFIKRVYCHAGENIAFNNEGIWGRQVLKQKVIAGVDKFVAITDAARDVLIVEGCDPAKIVRAQPGVDLTLFHPLPARKDQKIRLLFVGRLIEEKGIKEICRIFSRLQKKFPKLELAVVGSGPLVNALPKTVTYLGSVSYHDLPKIYSEADIYVHYSKGSKTWIEQYGFTLIEAMACGLPVIGLDKGSVAEVVGPGGLVVSAKDYEASLEKMIRDVNLRQKLGKKAWQFTRKNYDAYKYSQTLEKLFSL